MELFYWTGYCDKERIQAINTIECIINNYGFLTDFKSFSDISISITIEIEKQKIDLLYKDLKNYMSLKDFTLLNSRSDNECMILFNITFTKGTGNLKIEVPAIPG